MTTTVYAYQSDIIHLTADAQAFPVLRPHEVKTLCGRTIKSIGAFGIEGAVDGSMNQCPRCGTAKDFAAASADLSARQSAYADNERRQREADVREQRKARALRLHDVQALAECLRDFGADVTVEPNWRGATAGIRYGGHTYELTCK